MGNFIKLIQKHKLVLADFHVSWCGPCNVMAGVISEVKNKLEKKIVVVRIDMDKNEQTLNKFEVRGVPTLVLFWKGEEVWRKSGVTDANCIINTIKNYIERN